MIPVRINNPFGKNLVTDVVLNLFGYSGLIRLFFPNVKVGDTKNKIEGLSPGKEFKEFKKWAKEHIRFIESNIKKKSKEDSTPWYNEIWARQRIDDINKVLQEKIMFTVTNNNQVAVRNMEIDYEKSAGYQTIFLVIDKPKNKKNGQAFDIEVLQVDSKEQQIIGGQDIRIELVSNPKK